MYRVLESRQRGSKTEAAFLAKHGILLFSLAES